MVELDRRSFVRAVGVTGLLGAASGCGEGAGALEVAAAAGARPARMRSGASRVAGSRLASFGASILRSSAISATENAAISPYSIYSTLAMASAGARGATADQFASLLGGTAAEAAATVTAVDEAVAAAVTAGRRVDRKMAVDPANTIVLQRDLAVRQEFLRQLATGFGADARTADFARDADAARVGVNRWVSDRTHRLIPELLPGDALDSSTRMVLVNALYLKATWAEEFGEPSGSEVFTTATGARVTTPMMSSSRTTYSTGTGPDWRSVRLPYLGDRLAMTVVLPAPGAFAAVRGRLATVLPQAVRSSTDDLLDLSMPPFSVDTSTELTDALETLGLRDVFGPQADLSGMAGRPGELSASFVQHQAVVTVDQHGTEAAAATAMGVVALSAVAGTPTPFRVDRAFFFVVHDTTTGAPLFLGQMSRPAT